MTRLLPAALATLLAACTTNPAAGRWSGPMTPATPAPACPALRGTAQINRGDLLFTPGEGTWVLTGVANKDGTIEAERSQPATNSQAYETRLTGRWTPETVTGTYTTPRCTYAVQLTKR